MQETTLSLSDAQEQHDVEAPAELAAAAEVEPESPSAPASEDAGSAVVAVPHPYESRLRPYQAVALGKMRRALREGHRSICLVLPTGGGKTVLATTVVSSHLDRFARRGAFAHVLFVAHRNELIDQAAKTIRGAGIDRVCTVVGGRARGCKDPLVTVASVQTLNTARFRDNLPPSTLVVFDECHHLLATTWRTVRDFYSNATIVGLTATPERSDGSPLGDIFTTIIQVASTRELIELGWLVPVHVWGPFEPGKSLAENPVQAFQKWCVREDGTPMRTVIFVSSLPYGKTLAGDFVKLGIRANFVDGTMSKTIRKARLEAFESGQINPLINAQLLTEGWDDPGVEGLILTRKPRHAGTFLQMVGRELRISPETGKRYATLVDLCGACLEHGLPDADREFDLTGRTGIRKTKIAVKACPRCGWTASPWDGPCPRCGYEPESKAARPLDIDGREMVRLDEGVPLISRYQMRRYYLEQLGIARAKHFSDGWAWHRYREKYPDGPRFKRVPKPEEKQLTLRAGDWQCPRCNRSYTQEQRDRWHHASAESECEQCMLASWEEVVGQ